MQKGSRRKKELFVLNYQCATCWFWDILSVVRFLDNVFVRFSDSVMRLCAPCWEGEWNLRNFDRRWSMSPTWWEFRSLPPEQVDMRRKSPVFAVSEGVAKSSKKEQGHVISWSHRSKSARTLSMNSDVNTTLWVIAIKNCFCLSQRAAEDERRRRR